MLNIEIQCCGLVLDLLLIFFSTRHDRVGLRSENLFRTSLSINLSCIIMDILSVFMIVYHDRFPAFLVDTVCKLYLVLLLAVTYMAFLYAYSDIKRLRSNKRFCWVTEGLAIICSVVIMLLPIHYFCEGRSVYSYGPANIAAYIICPVFIISALLITIVFGSQMNPHKRRAVQAWMILEITAAGVQLLHPSLLLVGFGSAVGQFILYAELENPEGHQDKTTGIFSFECLAEYLRQLFDHEKRFAVIAILTGDEWKVEDTEHRRRILLDMAMYLHALPQTKVFRGIGNDFLVLYEPSGESDMEARCVDDLMLIRRRFGEPWQGAEVPVSYLYMTDSRVVVGVEELFSVYQYYRNEMESNQWGVIKVNYQAAGDIREYRDLRREIREAIEEDRVEVYYQPIYSVAEERFTSAEALARIRTRDGSIMMPGRFIPAAEKSGLISELGGVVMEKTCRFIAENAIKEKGVDYIEVNLSVTQCEDSSLADIYKKIINEHGISPETINLEITESAAAGHRGILIQNMERMKGFGCTFSLDDFGNGESNLNYIVDMPIDIVKFDSTMVQDYFRSERAHIVMESAVGMIRKLGLKIVAEGVETEEQFRAMQELQVDYIQGFYFSEPLIGTTFLKFIEK